MILRKQTKYKHINTLAKLNTLDCNFSFRISDIYKINQSRSN